MVMPFVNDAMLLSIDADTFSVRVAFTTCPEARTTPFWSHVMAMYCDAFVGDQLLVDMLRVSRELPVFFTYNV